MAKFWQDLGFLNALDTTDKILVGKNADGSTMYTDLQTVYNKISQVYFADAKPSVIAAGSVLTNPNSLTCHIAPAGTYTLPSGNVTLTGNINFFFWDFSAGWTWQSFSVQVGTSNMADASVTAAKLDVTSVYALLSQMYFVDTKPSVIAAGSVLTTPTSLTCYIAPAGIYTIPTGTITLSENLNLIFWDATGWSWISFNVVPKAKSVGFNELKDEVLNNSSEYIKLSGQQFSAAEIKILQAIRTLDIAVPSAQKNDDWRITFVSTIPVNPALVANFKYRIQIRNLTTGVDFTLVSENNTFDATTLNGIKTYRGNATTGSATVSYNVGIEWKILLDIASTFEFFNNTTSSLRLKVGTYSQSTELYNTLGNYNSSDFDNMRNLLQNFVEQTISPTTGYYVWNDGTVQPSGLRQYIYLNVRAGQRVKITTSIGGSAMFGAVFFDAYNKVIGTQFQGVDGGTVTPIDNQELIIPFGCAKIAINSLSSFTFKVYLGTFVILLPTKEQQDSNTSRISLLETSLTDTNSRLKTLDKPDFTINNGYYLNASLVAVPSGSRSYTSIPYTTGDEVYVRTIINGDPVFTAIFVNSAGTVIGTFEQGVNGRDKYVYYAKLNPPAGTATIFVNGMVSTPIEIWKTIIAKTVVSKSRFERLVKAAWEGKVILILGTSIPEGGFYWELCGMELGATVINLALGSSMMRIAKADGTINNLAWQNVCYALSHTNAEKDNIISNWSTIRNIFDPASNPPLTLDSTETAKIRGASWELRLKPYLDGTYPFPDLIIFDHLRNDTLGSDTEAQMITVPTDRNNRNYSLGAFNYIMDIIYSYNRDAKVCVFGHNENQEGNFYRTALAQQEAARYWEIPICKTWEKTGFSQQKVPNSASLWDQLPWSTYKAAAQSNGVDTSQNMTFKRLRNPDNIHIFTDTTLKSREIIKRIAKKFLIDLYEGF